MANIFIILFLASLAGAAVGVIRPSALRFQSRVRALLVFGGAAFVLLIAVGLTAGPRPTATATPAVATSTQPIQATNTVPSTVPPNPDDAQKAQIEQIVSGVPANGQYLGGGTIGKVDVYHTVDYSGDNNQYSGWGVDVDLHIEGSRAVMNEEMAEIYYALYSNRKDITAVAISVYEPVTDKYGNQKDMEVYHTFLKADEAAKVNWSLGHDGLVYTVLPGLWTTNLDMSAGNPGLLSK